MNGGGATKTSKATPKVVDDTPDTYGQVPRERWQECDGCGVERVHFRGTDPLTGVLRYVGFKCFYTIKRSDDIVEII